MAARRIDPARLAALTAGSAETRDLAECLAIDLGALLRTVDPATPADVLAGVRTGGIVARMRAAARHLGPRDDLAAHPSDTVRGWAALALGEAPGLDLGERLARLRAAADDHHFGVREWAWMALRPHLAAELPRALALLEPWTAAASPYLRRFASEATRPRGVWCAHLAALRADPAPGLILLEPLRADPERYVQDSVANWLNDAGKDHPDWVRGVCRRWGRESPGAATARIRTRALRTCGA